jgi:GNAT superfamily N-acetyltransferase
MVDRTRDPGAAADFMRIEASGWKGRGEGTAYARDPRKIDWFHEWSDYWGGTQRMKVLALNLGDTSIAMQYFIRAGDGIFLYRIAFDENYPKYGLGQMLLESALEFLFKETDADWLDACTDADNDFLLAMLPERRTTSTVLIGIGGVVDRTCVSATPTMSKAVVAQRRARERLARSVGSAATDG